MAERRHKQETQKAPKTYNIKMPVYTTSMIEQEEGLFGRVTYQDMISLLKERLKSFSFRRKRKVFDLPFLRFWWLKRLVFKRLQILFFVGLGSNSV